MGNGSSIYITGNGGEGGVFYSPPPENDTSTLYKMSVYDRWAYRMNMR